jgi:TolB protein
MNDDLRNSLSGIADDVRDVDLHERALGRSRQIRRNRITAATASAMAVLGLAGFGAVTLNGPRSQSGPQVAASVRASAAASVSAGTPSGPATVTMAVPQSKSLKDLTGHVFYRSPQSGSVIRIAGDGTSTTVLDEANDVAAVAPDGERIAYVANRKLYVSGSGQPLLSGKVDLAKQIPAWSPTGAELFVAAPEPGVLTVASGAFGKVPGGRKGQDFRWSGDGASLTYLVGGPLDRRIEVDGVTVPTWGDPVRSRNPGRLPASSPLSADPTAGRITVALSGARSLDNKVLPPDTVVDTATGAIEAIPVPGSVQAAIFDTEGNLLVRAKDGNRLVLSVFSPSGTLLVQAPEPSGVKDLDLLAYTR